MVIITLAVLSVIAIYNYQQGADFDNENRVFTMSNWHIEIGNALVNFQSGEDKDKLKEIALNITKDCEDDFCKTKAIYYRLDEFPYNHEHDGESLNPLSIWESGKGDCDEMAYLLSYLLKTINIKSTIQASPNHAWTIIYLEDKEILADLTKNKWEIIEK